jgi:hypothetical protein
MTSRELILLSPYSLPAQNSLMLSSDDVAAFLNGYSALWHPAASSGAVSPPRISSPYDYEQPTAGHIYATPDSPPLILPEDWDQRIRDAGAVAFRATADRMTTLVNLREALQSHAQATAVPPRFLDLEGSRVAPFFGIGFGYAMIEALFEAMEHEKTLSTGEFWQAVQSAIAALDDQDAGVCRRHLQSAADQLLAARETLYPVNIHLLDICLLSDEHSGRVALPASFGAGSPLNVVAAAAVLERLGQQSSECMAALRERVQADLAEVCGGPYLEREDALLPFESQLWNLLKGLGVYKELLGREVQVFARKRNAFHPQLPLLLDSVGLRRAVLLAFDESVIPTYRTSVINWGSPQGKQVEALTRAPFPAENPQTYFHWAHYLHQTIAQDHSATLGLLHRSAAAAPWYNDLLELSTFAPVLGRWTTLSKYFDEVLAGEYASAATADDFHGDYLTERTNSRREKPVGWFAQHIRLRRRFDSAQTLAALNRALAGRETCPDSEARLKQAEQQVETSETNSTTELPEVERAATEALANRLLVRASVNNRGYLLLNPCSFTRRAALTLDDVKDPLPITGPIKASQLDGTVAQLVVEVPGLGFAWIPRTGPPGAAPPVARMRLADARTVRNEFFEAEVDPQTGGLKALRDHRTRTNRIGQQLVFNPGSTMRAREVQMTSTGPALGEIVTQGVILDEHNQTLALYRQRFRAWLGRPLLELRFEITPQHEPQGYPWHAYYGARFAWRDERSVLLRGANGTGYVTSHTRPETPDYLELRSGRQSTVLFPGGLPFHQRHGSRMLDIVLIVERENTRTFDIGLGLDREYPMQTALGLVTPVPMVPTSKGPPHIGSAGWLFHLDAPNLMLTSMRPAAEGVDAVVARLVECSQYTTQAELRCVRDPQRAIMLDARGSSLQEVSASGDAVLFEVPSGDLVHVRVEF